MRRVFLGLVVGVGALIVAPYGGKAQKKPLERCPVAKSNQVYVKIILPTWARTRDVKRPVVESWIAEELKKRGQLRFAAATGWVPVLYKRDESTSTWVWGGTLDGKTWACPVDARIIERANGRIKVLLAGWAPLPVANVTVSLSDEPGSRAVAAVEKLTDDSGTPYVVVLIAPAPEIQRIPRR